MGRGAAGLIIGADNGGSAVKVVGKDMMPLGPTSPGQELARPGLAADLIPDAAYGTGGEFATGKAVQGHAAVPGKLVRLADPPPYLAEREESLAELDSLLTRGDGQGPRIVALSGPTGAGKTSLALEYAHRHIDEVGMVWQFAAKDKAVLAAGFGELAVQLQAQGVGTGWDSVTSVHRVLAALPAEWLLLFDDVRDRASVQAFLPPAGNGRVLITSRNRNWRPDQSLEVTVLDPEAAVRFLISRIGDQDVRTARELAGDMDGLPLALAQAAGYLQATGASLAEYLTSFRQQREEMVGRGEPDGHRTTVAATCALAFGRLQESAPVAAGLLRLLAFCAPGAVPLRLLLQPRPGLTKGLPRQVGRLLVNLLEDPVAAEDAVATLRRYSLVSSAAEGIVSVQRLVRAVTVGQMPEDLARIWRGGTAAVIEAAIPSDPEQPDSWPDFAALVPHAQAALPADSYGVERVASFLGFSGSYVIARELWQDVVEARVKVLGSEHPETLSTRASLAYWCGQAGDAAGARDLFAALLPVCESVYGPDDPDTLRVRNHLARWSGKAGDVAGARDQYAALLLVRESVYGPDHPDTLATRANHAYWSGEAGDVTGARDLFAALLPVCESVYGPDDPDTLRVRNHLARWSGEAGDVAGARDQYAALLPVCERVYGPDHPDTLETRANLATWAGAADDPAETRDRYAALLAIREKVYGPDDPDTLATYANVAYWSGEAGDAAGARDQFAALLPVSERVYGPDHPDTLKTQARLAGWSGEAGDAVAARDGYAALLPVIDRILGPEHRDSLNVRSNLARWSGEAGDAVAARDGYAALLPVIDRILGPEHRDSLNVRSNLARWSGEAGDVAGARDQYAALLPVCEKVYGPDHPDTLETRADLAYWTGAAGDAAGARDQFAALLQVRQRVNGPVHPETLIDRASLAAWTGEANDPAGARDQHTALLPDLERVRGPEHPATLAVRANLANLTGLAGDPAGARDHYAALLPVIERVHGSKHPASQKVRENLAYWTKEARRRHRPAHGLED